MKALSKTSSLRYESETGLFYRDFKKGLKLIPGANNSDGYKNYKEDGKTIAGHILAFKCMGIEIPDGFEVDHLDKVKSNNKWKNLVLKTHADNMINTNQRRKRFALGVHKLPSGRFRVRFRDKHIGVFDILKEANDLSYKLRHDKTEPDIK